MKTYTKKEILNIIHIWVNSNNTILEAKEITEGEVTDIVNVLTKCQNSAVDIGTFVESLDDRYGYLIRILEEYCENLYQLSINLLNKEARRNSAEKINELLDDFISGISDNLPEDKKEVVFLPYKASMWDSLESVWRAANEDPDVDTYVIPIPYYDKNPDGSFKKEHYEGDEYPDYVPITSWKEYNMEVRHPAKIFIHNPYDGANKVTSVHPNFYASVLKNQTDQLIYIPYFVCVNDDVPEHFIVLPGTIHANKVILQSEKVRDAYIEGFSKQLKEQGIENIFGDLRDKFIAVGSPKIDKVLATNKENITIPKEWQHLLNTKNIKVMLYNTTLHAFMNNPEQYIRKLISVLGTFRENDKMLLLWRPHPLMRETIESMHPAYLRQYDTIVNDYKDGGWGIYDDSADVNRAIALSDAYYGDMSSVVELYKATGKPIMIQNVNIV